MHGTLPDMFRARRPWLAAVLTAVAVAGCGPDMLDLLPAQGGTGGGVSGMSSVSAGTDAGGSSAGSSGAAGSAGAELGGSGNPSMSGATFGGRNSGGFGGCTGFGCGGSDFGDGGGFDGPSCAEIFNNGSSCIACGGASPTCPGRYKCNYAGFCMPSCNTAFDCAREKLEGFVCGADHTCTVCGFSLPDTCRQQYGFDRPYCIKNRCEQCRTGDDCLDDDRALCIDNHCEPCAADVECPTGKCDRSSGRCIKP